MSLEQDVRGMAGTRPFSLMPREALQLLAFSCERRSYRPGDILFSVGDPADSAYFLLSGEVELTAHGAKRTVKRGALLGESALASEVTRLAQARAVTDSTALRVPRDIFRRRRENARERGAADAPVARPARGRQRAGVQDLTFTRRAKCPPASAT